jgi:uncharacterized protein (TIGR00369 family)
MTVSSACSSPGPSLSTVVGGDSELPPAPIYSHGALTGQAFGDGTCAELLRVADWMCERDGRPTLGALALLADSATGWSVSTRLTAGTSMVTAQLRLELFDGVPREVPVFNIRAQAVHADAEVAFARADLTADRGRPVGMTTMRSALVPHPATQDGFAERAGAVVPRLPEGFVDDVLDTEFREASAQRTEVAVRTRPQLANLAGNIHGGVVVMMAERAIVPLLASIGDPAAFRPLDIDIVYARPLEADDTIATASAAVLTTTRRFVQLSVLVTRPDGRVAATVRAAYARPA